MPIYTTREYIRDGQYVYFRGTNWEDFFAEKVFRVDFSQLFPYRLPGYVVKAGSYLPLDLKETLKLYPDSQYTLYEIGVALKGDVTLYVQLPLGQFYFYLEAVGSPATPTGAGYMGAFTSKDLPEEEQKKILEKKEEYVVKGLLVELPHWTLARWAER